jgi:O-antigen/teichoic acid export membrane protein
LTDPNLSQSPLPKPARTPVLQSLWRSSALRAAAALGGSGLALAAGNLLLARVLPTDEFARFALMFSLVMVGISIAPIGADVILVRRHFVPDSRLHRQVLCTSVLVATALVVAANFLYPLPITLLAVIGISVIAGGMKTVAVAYFRSQERFNAALALTVSTNASLLLASVIGFVAGARSALLPGIAMSLSLALTAALGWRAVTPAMSSSNGPNQYAWSEGWSAVSFASAGMILGAFERLLAPRLLDLRELATFSVLATIAGSPFQMLQLGVGYTLVPGLRNAKTAAQRIKVFKHEAMVVVATAATAGVVVWMITPSVLHWILNDRYSIAWPLLTAALVTGSLKVISSLAASVVNALGSGRHLLLLSGIGWVAIALGFIGALLGVRWGLTGLVFGVGVGWLFRGIAVFWIAAPQLWLKRD